MKQIETILVGVDFGEASSNALSWATLLAARLGARVVLAHAIEQVGLGSVGRGLSGSRLEALARIQALGKETAAHGVQVGEPVVAVHTAHELLVETAASLHANLIVLGATHGSRTRRLLSGGTAESVVCMARQPVWVVHPSDIHGDLDCILVAVDYSHAAARALRVAIDLARAFVGRLVVLHVLGEGQPLDQRGSDADSQEQFSEWLRGFDLEGLPHKALVARGDVAEQVLTTANGERVRVAVLGAMGDHSIWHQMTGNTTMRVLRRLPCAMLTVRRQDLYRNEQHAAREERPKSLSQVAQRLQEVYSHGRAQLAKGLLDDAILAFAECLELDPYFTDAHDGIAEVCERANLHERARNHRALARRLRERIWEQTVQAEVRGHSALFE